MPSRRLDYGAARREWACYLRWLLCLRSFVWRTLV